MLYVECLADEALARHLGLRRREIEHELNKDEVLKRLTNTLDSHGMVDEDPNSPTPVQFGRMLRLEDSSQWGILRYLDGRRSNQVIVLRPDLEGWLIRSARDAGISIAEAPYSLPVNPKSLHRVINDRLDKLQLVVNALITANSSRILKLQELLTS